MKRTVFISGDNVRDVDDRCAGFKERATSREDADIDIE